MLRILLIFIGILLLINFIGRILFHWIIRRLIRKSQENFMKQQGFSDTDSTVNSHKKNQPKNTKSLGEYVDFEEIP